MQGLGNLERFPVLLQRFLVGLLIGAVGLPILLCVIIAVERLLDGMQDAVGAAALGRIGLGLFILWVANLIGLVIVQALQSLGGPRPPSDNVE
jgi:hypothetical protein